MLAAWLKLKQGSGDEADSPSRRPAAAGPDAASKPADQPADQVKESKADPNIVVVAELMDMLDGSRFWTREERMFGQSMGYSKLADNGDFVDRVCSTICRGSSDLISIRAGGEYALGVHAACREPAEVGGAEVPV